MGIGLHFFFKSEVQYPLDFTSTRGDVQRGALFHSTPIGQKPDFTFWSKVKSNGYWTSLFKKSEVQWVLDFTFFYCWTSL